MRPVDARVDHGDADRKELRLRRPERPGAIAVEVPLASRKRLRVHERSGRRGHHDRGDRNPDRGPASHGATSVAETPGASPCARSAPDAIGTCRQSAREAPGPGRVGDRRRDGRPPGAADCCWSCTAAATSAGPIDPLTEAAPTVASTRGATAIFARPTRTSPLREAVLRRRLWPDDHRERAAAAAGQRAGGRPVRRARRLRLERHGRRRRAPAPERHRPAVGHGLAARHSSSRAGVNQVERRPRASAHLLARERRLRVVRRDDGDGSTRPDGAGLRFEVGDRREKLQLLRTFAVSSSTGPQSWTARACRTGRATETRYGTACRSPRAPTPCGRRRSRRRTCPRPCRCKHHLPRVAATAALVGGDSRRCRRRPGSACRCRGRTGPLARFASAYERAATACAFSAAGGPVDGTSDGTTALRYCSSPTRSITWTSLPVAETESLPRNGAPSTEIGSAAENVYGGCSADRAASVSAPLRTIAPGASFARCPAESVTVQGTPEVQRHLLRRDRAGRARSPPSQARARCPCSSGRECGCSSSRASHSRRRPTGSSRGRGPSRDRRGRAPPSPNWSSRWSSSRRRSPTSWSSRGRTQAPPRAPRPRDRRETTALRRPAERRSDPRGPR